MSNSDTHRTTDLVRRLRSLTDLTPSVTAIADETLFKDAADEIEKLRGERALIATELRKRATWLRTQADKGYYVIPSAKADECLWLADRIEKGITP